MTIRQTAEHTGIYKITRSTGEGFADTIALMKQVSEARQREKTAWVDEVEGTVKATLESSPVDPTVRGDAEDAWGYLNLVRAALAQGTIRDLEAGYWVYQLGRAVERMQVRPFELLVKKNLHLVTWRGRFCTVTELEHRILAYMVERTEASLADVVKSAWDEPFDPTKRSKYDKAICQLNTKLSEAQIVLSLSVHGDRLVREETVASA